METITVKDIGPVKELSFQLEDYGLTVLTAKNGKGKSIVLDAIQKAALGKGRLPLRDGARRGMVDAGGVVITVGGTTRYTGEFQIENLESRLPLAQLVDPGHKSADASDRARIRALVALTGVEASRELFTSHEAFSDFGEVVSDDATATDDLVEMAGRVKREYESKARDAEKEADREEGHVRGLEEAAEGLDMDAESDADALQQAYDAARDEVTRITSENDRRSRSRADVESARTQLANLREGYQGQTVDEADAAYQEADKAMAAAENEVERLQKLLADARNDHNRQVVFLDAAAANRDRAHEHAEAVATLENTIKNLGGDSFDLEDDKPAIVKRDAAKAAMEQGVSIRDARAKLERARQHKDAAAAARKRSERLRDASHCVDEVLSSAIDCDRLRIESVDGVARLVVDHPDRGNGVPYHELSDGERWKLAIDLGVEQVGEGGLLVIEQPAFEGIDAENRRVIHEHAVERKVFLLTAEASRSEANGEQIVAKGYAPA